MLLDSKLDDLILAELCKVRFQNDWGATPADILKRTYSQVLLEKLKERLRQLVDAGVVVSKVRQEATGGTLRERFLLAEGVLFTAVPCQMNFKPDETSQAVAACMETAAQFLRNAEFYRGIVVQIGEMFGAAAKTGDDGTVQDDVLALKVPELVRSCLDNGHRQNERSSSDQNPAIHRGAGTD